MTADIAGKRADTTWADLLAEGRLPRFALIMLGVWLMAADSLVTATILPSVGADLGGYGGFGWATAGFFLGAIVAGASAGRLSEVFGLRPATAFAGLVFAFGCALSAAAPDMGLFLAGRLVQGVGGGWISGFAMVAVARLFPERHLARVFASVSGVWGIATLLGPAVGGVFADAGQWRPVFWLFAAQAVMFSAAALPLLKAEGKPARGPGIPWPQLAILALAVAAIGAADLAGSLVGSALLVGAGLALLAVLAVRDGRFKVRLLPLAAADLRTVCGAGYLAMFALTAASMGFSIYAPAVLQELRGYSPLFAGYVVGAEALAWTLAAFVAAGATGAADRRWVRFGALCVVVSLVLLPWALDGQPLAWVLAGASLLGAGFGFSWALMSQRVLAALSDEDRAIGASGITAVRQTGAATGAAIAGVTANLVGFSAGLTPQSAQSVSLWIFVTALPLALAGAWAAFRLTGSARAPSGEVEAASPPGRRAD